MPVKAILLIVFSLFGKEAWGWTRQAFSTSHIFFLCAQSLVRVNRFLYSSVTHFIWYILYAHIFYKHVKGTWQKPHGSVPWHFFQAQFNQLTAASLRSRFRIGHNGWKDMFKEIWSTFLFITRKYRCPKEQCKYAWLIHVWYFWTPVTYPPTYGILICAYLIFLFPWLIFLPM